MVASLAIALHEHVNVQEAKTGNVDVCRYQFKIHGLEQLLAEHQVVYLILNSLASLRQLVRVRKFLEVELLNLNMNGSYTGHRILRFPQIDFIICFDLLIFFICNIKKLRRRPKEMLVCLASVFSNSLTHVSADVLEHLLAISVWASILVFILMAVSLDGSPWIQPFTAFIFGIVSGSYLF